MDELAAAAAARLTLLDPATKVFKDECVASVASAEDRGGLFVNLISFNCFAPNLVDLDFKATDCPVYLHVAAERVYKKPNDQAPAAEAPTKMAIGKDGGFGSDEVAKFDLKTDFKLVFYPDKSEWPLTATGQTATDKALPEKLENCVRRVIEYSSAAAIADFLPWEEEKPQPFQGTIPQIEGRRVDPPSDWKCAVCGATKNLWLNLSDGYVGCGRKQYKKGMGGCHDWTAEGAAVLHFESHRDRQTIEGCPPRDCGRFKSRRGLVVLSRPRIARGRGAAERWRYDGGSWRGPLRRKR
eukprot:Selendium_serpulae@DN1789_c0_g1_i1.p1